MQKTILLILAALMVTATFTPTHAETPKPTSPPPAEGEEEGEDDSLIGPLVVASLIATLIWYFFLRDSSSSSSSSSSRVPTFAGVSAVRAGSGGSSSSSSSSFGGVGGKRKLDEIVTSSSANLVVLFGTQTGTAEEFAHRIAAESRSLGAVPAVVDVDLVDFSSFADLATLPPLSSTPVGAKPVALVFVVATYGEGEPTDSAVEFHEWLVDDATQDDMDGLAYAVFGLGDRTYEHFNAMARVVDERMDELGGVKIAQRGEGDDDGNIEADFMLWQEEHLLPGLTKALALDPDAALSASPVRRYALQDQDEEDPHPSPPPRPGAHDARHPYQATVLEVSELHSEASDRSCMLVKFDLAGSMLSYQASDHLGLCPRNDPALVEELGARLGVDMDRIVALPALEPDDAPYFPGAATVRNVLSRYVDITSPPSRHLLRAFASLADDQGEAAELKDMSSMSSASGKARYAELIEASGGGVVELLAAFPSITFGDAELGFFIENSPKLQPRYYSISSAPSAVGTEVHITAVLSQHAVGASQELTRNGVATGFLATLSAGDVADVYIRTSSFRLPADPSVPIIMVGPGTGIAPFRAFLQDRAAAGADGADLGPAVLFFGCRSESIDYIYRDELEDYLDQGVLSDLHVAFSRDGDQKVYVQHLLKDQADAMWSLISDQHAYVYICGDAKYMAPDVRAVLLSTIMQGAGLKEDRAKYYLDKMAKKGRFQQDVW